MNEQDIEAKKLVFDRYVSVNNGNIDFKSQFNQLMDNGYVSREDALNIIYELMYGVIRYGYDENEVKEKFEDLTKKVKGYNLDTEETVIKNGILFYNDYSHVKKLVKMFCSDSKSVDCNENKITPDMNDTSAKDSDSEKYQIKPSAHHQYNPHDNSVSLEIREKKELDRQIRELSKELRKIHPQNWREILKESPIYKKRHDLDVYSQTSKGNVESVKRSTKEVHIEIDKIREFNELSLQDMISLKSKYSEIYKAVANRNFMDENDDIIRFVYYFSHTYEVNSAKNLFNRLDEFRDDMDDFYNRFTHDGYLTEHKRKKLIKDFKKLFVLASWVNGYHPFIRKKITDEFKRLNYFIECYEDLKEYTHFNETSDNNHVKYVNRLYKRGKLHLPAGKIDDSDIELQEDILQEYYLVKNMLSKRQFLEEIEMFKDDNSDNPFITDKSAAQYIVRKVMENSSNDDFGNNGGFFSKYKFGRSLKFKERYEKYGNNISEEELLEEIGKLDGYGDDLSNFNDELENNEEYLPYSKRNYLIDRFNDLYQWASRIYYCPHFENHVTYDFCGLIDFIESYEDLREYTDLTKTDVENRIRKINEAYLDKEITDNEDFFKDINDPNKKRAIVIDEDNVKVVAGAGAGKTFIIQKRVNYLIQKKRKDPEKILCLCYTRKSVNQLSQRVNRHAHAPKVKVFTFHEFCRRVSKECHEINRPNRYLLDDIIRKYVFDIVNDSEKLAKLSEYFSYYSFPQSESQVFDSLEEYEEHREGNKIVSLKKKYYQCKESMETIKGEEVKSLGELIIANYLFMHDIEYEYERKYPYYEFADMIYYRFFYSGAYFSLNQISECSKEDLVNSFLDLEYGRRLTRPDFYLPKYDIYLEHFGVDENMEATFLRGVAKEKYEMSMKSKRIWHEMYGTKLIETYSHYFSEGRLLIELEDLLEQNKVTIGQIDKRKIIDMLIKNSRVKDFDRFSKLVKSFINIFESKNQKKLDFDEFREKNNGNDIYTKNRQNLFFDIAEEIYNDYYKENESGTLSHNHEILNALDLIQSKKFNKQYDYIFIDEYQDINQVRCKLLQELQKNSNSKIYVVGDDWQSIYGFSGSEVELFTNFNQYFKNPEIIKIEENRRNPQELIKITSDFITRNEKQDKKDLEYYKEVENPNLEPIKIVRYLKKKVDYNLKSREIEDVKRKNRRSKILKLDAVIDDILKNSDNPKILILGRNNDDIDDYVGNDLFKEVEKNNLRKIIYYERQDLDITYMTIHQSKGLQCDEVILLNLEDAYDGFPNKMEDDPILRFVKSDDECEFAEERRLLYVALTRTRNNAYLMAPSSSSSVFIDYLLKYEGAVQKDLLYRDRRKFLHLNEDFLGKCTIHTTDLDCPNPNCDDGKIAIIENHLKKTKYVRCNLHPRDSYHYNGGPYPASLKDIKYVKKCPTCRGILVRQGDILRCCLNYHEGCMEIDDKLKLDIEDLEYDYE